MNERPFQFKWDEAKADANARKHGVTFELATTVFFDPRLLTVADVEHSKNQGEVVFCGSRQDRHIGGSRLSLV